MGYVFDRFSSDGMFSHIMVLLGFFLATNAKRTPIDFGNSNKLDLIIMFTCIILLAIQFALHI